MPVAEKAEVVTNAAGRSVLEVVNGRPQTPYMGIGKYRPTGAKASAPIHTVADGALSSIQARACFDDEVIGCGLRTRRGVLRRESGDKREGRGRSEERTESMHGGGVCTPPWRICRVVGEPL